MITIERPKLSGAVRLKEYWFADKISYLNLFRQTVYVQSSRTKRKFGYFSERFCTKLIDLKKSELELRSLVRKNFFNLVRRAEKDGVLFAESEDWTLFVDIYNKFAAVKGLSPIAESHFSGLNEVLKILVAVHRGNVVVAHVYIVDRQKKIVRQLHVAYDTTKSDKGYLDFIGNANRFLHWESIMYFKNQGFTIFDLGGYSEDPKLIGINIFKDNFRGELVVYRNFYSITLVFFLVIKFLLKKVLLNSKNTNIVLNDIHK